MDTPFVNYKNSKTSEPDRLVDVLNPVNKINLTRKVENVALWNLSMYYTWKKNTKTHTKTTNSKYQFQQRMKNLIYLMDRVLY